MSSRIDTNYFYIRIYSSNFFFKCQLTLYRMLVRFLGSTFLTAIAAKQACWHAIPFISTNLTLHSKSFICILIKPDYFNVLI